MNLTNFIGVADLHLTANPNDEYRWLLFEQLINTCTVSKIDDVILVGDIADFKDNHGSDFVNKLSTHIGKLAQVARVHFLMGNHDMVKPDVPYFEFLNLIPNVFYYKEPAFLGKVALLPYTKGAEQVWADIDFSPYDHIFMHQPCIGAKSSDHYELVSGMSGTYFSDKHKEFDGCVWSGDIHIPQVVGDVEYLGAPYPVRFGDKIEGRAIVFEDAKGDSDWVIADISLDNIKKWSIMLEKPADMLSYTDKVNHCSSYPDQMKVKVAFSPEAFKNWSDWKEQIKKHAEELGVQLFGISLESKKVDFESVDRSAAEAAGLDTTNHVKVFETFSKKEKVDKDLLKFGKQFLEGTE